MKTNPISTMAPAELKKKLAEIRDEMRTLRFNAAGARAKDPSAISKLRKDIARINTALAKNA